jgi:geranylgeranyl diphosphate synthase type II
VSERNWAAALGADRLAVNERLAALLPPGDLPPASLHEAMRYAALGGGKRLRAVLCIAAHRLFGNPYPGAALDAGCAIECLHAYTLVHDDLPALDDDDLRRGRPTCHKKFGEAVAILAGDALQAEAFDVLARCGAPEERIAEAVRVLARSSGSRFLVGGQTADLEGEGATPTDDLVRFIHGRKTAELIAASLSIGAAIAGAPESSRREIHEAGRLAGLAFQISDDLLDVLGIEEQAGKGLRKDAERRKITYPALHGVERSRADAGRLAAEAARRVAALGDDGYLDFLFASMAERTS